MTFIAFQNQNINEEKNYFPTPGIEPGPPGWKPGILAIRPRGINVSARARTGDLSRVRRTW